MVGISFRPDLDFDIFDALGLDPTYYNTTESDTSFAWLCVCSHLHPSCITENRPHVPQFPTFGEAERAYKFLLNLDFSGSPYSNTSKVRIRIAILRDAGRLQKHLEPVHQARDRRSDEAHPRTDDRSAPSPNARARHGVLETGAACVTVRRPEASKGPGPSVTRCATGPCGQRSGFWPAVDTGPEHGSGPGSQTAEAASSGYLG
ncbi:hypothetical protein MMC34_000628 [Xylographa carneopallida]|nr:hypothetical protein [Xylographa carneopallida]